MQAATALQAKRHQRGKLLLDTVKQSHDREPDTSSEFNSAAIYLDVIPPWEGLIDIAPGAGLISSLAKFDPETYEQSACL